MRVEAANTLFYTSRHPQPSIADRHGTAFSAALATAGASDTASPAGAPQPDFTSMTRQEMRDWVNDRIRRGDMSLDDSRPFMAMTLKISVDGSGYGEVPAASDGERIDFTQRVRDGIAGAVSQKDDAALRALQTAMHVMQIYQGPARTGDRHA